MNAIVSAASAILLAATSLSASALDLVLQPSNVIGSSGSFSSTFAAGNILNRQIGTVTDVRGEFWLSPTVSDPQNTFITVDLGAPYVLDWLVLFNTHNDSFYDRGTGSFRVLGGNSVVDLGGGNFRLTGSTSVLVQGTLAAVAAANPPPVVFDVTDTNSFRYLSFQPLTVATVFQPASATAFGLNEMRVAVVAVPEPGTWATMLTGIAFLGMLAVRRRRSLSGAR